MVAPDARRILARKHFRLVASVATALATILLELTLIQEGFDSFGVPT